MQPRTKPLSGGTKKQQSILVRVQEECQELYYVCRRKDDESGAEAAHYALLAKEKELATPTSPTGSPSSPSLYLVDWLPRCFNDLNRLVTRTLDTTQLKYTKDAFS